MPPKSVNDILSTRIKTAKNAKEDLQNGIKCKVDKCEFRGKPNESIYDHVIKEHNLHPATYIKHYAPELTEETALGPFNRDSSNYILIGGYLINKVDTKGMPVEGTNRLVTWPHPVDFKFDEASIPVIGKVLSSNARSLLLEGETGTGKTAMARYIASTTHGRGQPFFRINLDGGATVDQILGKPTLKDGTVMWTDGDLITAMRIGGLVVLDEISAARPEMLFALYSLLDDDHMIVLKDKEDCEVVRPHPDFRLIATTNPRYGDVNYTGVKELNPALKDRFEPIIIRYMHPDDETEYVSAVTGAPSQVVHELVSLANKVRNKEVSVYATFSTRLVMDLAEWSHDKPVYDIASVLLPGKMGQEEGSKILKLMAGVPEFRDAMQTDTTRRRRRKHTTADETKITDEHEE